MCDKLLLPLTLKTQITKQQVPKVFKKGLILLAVFGWGVDYLRNFVYSPVSKHCDPDSRHQTRHYRQFSEDNFLRFCSVPMSFHSSSPAFAVLGSKPCKGTGELGARIS